MAGNFDVEVNLTGFEQLIARLTVLPGNAKEGALRGMFTYCDEVMMPDSKENYCPFDLGALRDSGTVFRDENFVYAEYGSPAAPGRGKDATPPSEYAVDQHENPTYDHRAETGHGGGQWKYLEEPLTKHSSRILEAAAEGVDIALEVDTGLGVDIRQISYAGTLGQYLNAAAEKHSHKITKPADKKPAGPRLVKKKK